MRAHPLGRLAHESLRLVQDPGNMHKCTTLSSCNTLTLCEIASKVNWLIGFCLTRFLGVFIK
jgi:hypothetical protein